MGVINKVEVPTEWCAPMIFVSKTNGQVRICVDLTKLNANIRREFHPLPDVEIHDKRLHQVLKHLEKGNITLNKEKCEFNESQIKIIGNIVNSNGISPDPNKGKAVVDLPAPRNISQIRSFLGIVNQFSKFTDHLADKTKPIRDLLVEKNSWSWGATQKNAFQEIKKCLISTSVLAL